MRKILVLALLVTLAGCGDTTSEKNKKSTDDDKDKKTVKVIPAAPIIPVTATKTDQDQESDESDKNTESPDAKVIAAAPIIPMPANKTDQDQEPDETDQDAEPTVASVIKQFETGMSDFMKKYQAASDDEKQELVENELPKADDYASKMMDLVNVEPTSDEAAEGLIWIVQNTRGEMGTKATEMLLEHHLESEVMADLAARKSRATPTTEEQKFLDDLIAKSPVERVERVKGVASYARVMQMKYAERTFKYYQKQLAKAKEEAGDEESPAVPQAQEGYDQFVKDLSPDTLEFLKTGKTTDGTDFETMLEEVNKNYADVVLTTRNDKTILVGDKCESTLFELRNLLVGKTAPDIEGEDLDGEAFKLSDYRGKVVVIDFWGDW